MGPYLLAEIVVEPINTQGWIVMVTSITIVLGLMAYCFTKVLRLPPVDVEEHLKAPLDIETGDD